jgi:cytochrome c556
MRKELVLAALTLALGCAPDKNTPVADIPKLTKLDEVMDNQRTAADPQFAKVGNATFTDADFATFGEAAVRIQATSLKSKEFSGGKPEFEALALRVNERAKALAAAAAAKDAAGAKTALTEMKAACKECHSKFR